MLSHYTSARDLLFSVSGPFPCVEMPVLNIRMKRNLVRVSLLAVAFFIFDLFWSHLRAAPSETLLKGNTQNHISKTKTAAPKERIFIASTHWNNEIVLRSHWNTAILNLVQSLGPENVYVSIVESGSYDNTKGALIELDYYLGELGINRTISLSDASHADAISRGPEEGEEGWIDTPRGRRELRRIPFLSRERNESLKPLAGLETEFGVKFDKILFLNDVLFTVCPSLFLYLWHSSAKTIRRTTISTRCSTPTLARTRRRVPWTFQNRQRFTTPLPSATARATRP